MADTPASIREVAAHAGVSVGTVSNVLNRPDIVAEPTRSRVRDAIKQLGFIRNESARQLRAGAVVPSAWSCLTWPTRSSPTSRGAWRTRPASRVGP